MPCPPTPPPPPMSALYSPLNDFLVLVGIYPTHSILLFECPDSNPALNIYACMQCWHGGLRTVARLKSSMHAMVKEYLANPDSPASLREAHQSLRELSVPHFHHEYIKQILSAAFDHAPQVTALANLLQYHSTSGAQLFGFWRCPKLT